jgi:hypothetical protein
MRNLTNITTIMKVSLLRATHEVIIGFVCIVKWSFTEMVVRVAKGNRFFVLSMTHKNKGENKFY